MSNMTLNGSNPPELIPSSSEEQAEAISRDAAWTLNAPKRVAQKTLDTYDAMGMTRAWEDLMEAIPGAENALPQLVKDRLADKRAARAVLGA